MNIPEKFEDILKAIKTELKGKTNPKTKKPYTDSDIYAISVSTYKKKYGNAPSKEESPKWYFDGTKEIREDVKLNWEEVIEFDHAVNTSESPLTIKGRAINETITSNRVKYVSEELDNAAPSMIGKPLLNSHNHDDVRETLGKVVDAKKVAGGIDYIAEIDPDERKIINKVKRGYISKVSICADCRKLEKEIVEEKDDAYPVYVAKGMTFRELSLVTVPGDDNSSISVESAISESFNNEVCEEFLQDSINKVDTIEVKKEEIKVNEMSEDIKVMEEKLAVALKEKADMAAKLAVIEAEKAKEQEASKLKSLISEAVKAELAKADEEKKEEEKKDEKAEEKSNAPIVSEAKSSISDKMGDTMNRLIIERGANGTSFYCTPKEDIKGGLQ